MHFLPRARIDADPVHTVFVMRLHPRENHVGAKALHAHGGMACSLQALVQVVERGFAGHQQRKPVAESVGCLQPPGPVAAGEAPVRRIEAHQAAGLAQKGAEPARCGVARVPGGHGVVPHRHGGGHRCCVGIQAQVRHARGPQHERIPRDFGPDQRHARQRTLGQEHALGIDHHPGTVGFQPGFGQQGFAHLGAGAGFHGIDEQARNAALQVGFGVKGHGHGLAA